LSTLADILLSARASGDYNQVLAALPYARFLGLQASLNADTLRVTLPFQPTLVGNPALPALHGGVVGACLEMAALLQVVHLRNGPPFPKTVDFTVDYLRAARAEALHAEAEVQRLGRRIVNVRMRAFQGDGRAPVALGRGNFLVD
jgi:uncharacterized protein (TIGR00369 family)